MKEQTKEIFKYLVLRPIKSFFIIVAALYGLLFLRMMLLAWLGW